MSRKCAAYEAASAGTPLPRSFSATKRGHTALALSASTRAGQLPSALYGSTVLLAAAALNSSTVSYMTTLRSASRRDAATMLSGCSAKAPLNTRLALEGNTGEPATMFFCTCSFQSRITDALLYPCEPETGVSRAPCVPACAARAART